MLTRDIIRAISKPLKMSFAADKIKITRSGLSTNPVQRFSFTGGDIFRNDELVTTKGIITEVAQSKTYDFSQANVPMKFYRYSGSPTALVPTSSSWVMTDSSNLISQDSNVYYNATSSNGNIYQLMVELDLTDLVNQQGGLTRFKDLLSGITVDTWTKGSGSNAGVSANGVNMNMWANGTNQWMYPKNHNNTSVSKLTITPTSSDLQSSYNPLTSSNKLYILIASQYASDGTISSSVSLDYISIKIDYKQRSVTKDGAFFVGGDTATYEFDMSLKVAGSVAECPMKIYGLSDAPLLRTPSDTWNELIVQSNIDLIKTRDGNSYAYGTTINTAIRQMMLELDLTPLCNSMFGGSNSALKSALKAINVDVWAMGSGSNAGVQTNGVNVKRWSNTGTWSFGGGGSNSQGTIQKISGSLTTPSDTADTVNSSNKIYFLIASQYASDGTIASSVSLDYLNIKIDLARTADTVQPISVNLPKYWAMVCGISPKTYANITNDKVFVSMYKDSLNRFDIKIYQADKKLYFGGKNEGYADGWATSANGLENNYKMTKIIAQQHSSGLKLFRLDNNGTMEVVSVARTPKLMGLISLYLGTSYINLSYNMNAFAESFHLLDLQRMGKQNGLTDAEALSILKGQMHIKENNLIVNGDFSQGTTGWSKAYSTFSTSMGIATITGDGTAALPSLVKAIPSIYSSGKKMYVKSKLMVTNSNCQNLICRFYNNSISILLGEAKIISPVQNQWYDLSAVITLATGAVVGEDIKLYIREEYADNSTANGKVMQVQQVYCLDLTALFGAGNEPTPAQMDAMFTQGSTNPISLTNPELFDINKVTLHANATRSGNTITLNATTATVQTSTLNVPILPNNVYRLKGTISAGARLKVGYYYNNVFLSWGSLSADLNDLTFTTPNDCNNVSIGLDNSSSGTIGTFTFSNISLRRKD